MKIEFKGKYKSLTDFVSENLSDFVVITGKNGSGKSQLLQVINETYNQNVQKQYELKVDPVPKRVQSEDLVVTNISATNESIRGQIEYYITAFSSLKPALKEFYSLLYTNNLSIKSYNELSLLEKQKILSTDNLVNYYYRILLANNYSGISTYDEERIYRTVEALNKSHVALLDLLLIIKEFSGKSLDRIDRNDFYSIPIPEKYIDLADLFSSKIEVIIYAYLKRRDRNDYNYFRKEKYGEHNSSISDSEFETRYPAPWVIINKILSANNVGILIEEFTLKDFSNEMMTQVKYYKEGMNNPVLLSDLSSGEQVIVSLIIRLFTKEYYEKDLRLPDLIILDEPDAYLHPEMSKLLLDIIFKSFVKDLGIRVILTTHSPSTVALAPEDCIYEMTNIPICTLKKIGKDEALNLLTGLLPTLSIDYRNHKQIFLESPTDVVYFQNLFNKLHSEEKLNHRLYFISNEKGKSNCDWVNEIVQKLRSTGMTKVFGIIDWDSKNSSSDFVIVHGEGTRYSIENFLFDAVYLVILFLENNGANNIRQELNISETYNQYSIVSENLSHIQEIWNYFIKKICLHFPAYELKFDSEIKYYSNKIVKVPSWFLTMKGHELDEKLRKCFPSLQKYNEEGKLQKELSIIMAKCYPFVPYDSIALIKQLAI